MTSLDIFDLVRHMRSSVSGVLMHNGAIRLKHRKKYVDKHGAACGQY